MIAEFDERSEVSHSSICTRSGRAHACAQRPNSPGSPQRPAHSRVRRVRSRNTGRTEGRWAVRIQRTKPIMDCHAARFDGRGARLECRIRGKGDAAGNDRLVGRRRREVVVALFDQPFRQDHVQSCEISTGLVCTQTRGMDGTRPCSCRVREEHQHRDDDSYDRTAHPEHAAALCNLRARR